MKKRLCLHVLLATIAIVLTSRPAATEWLAPGAADLHRTWIYKPASTLDNGRHALMVVLHGCAQSNDELKQFGNLERAAENGGFVLAVPAVGERYFGPKCWDYNGATDEHDNAKDIIALTRDLESRPALNIDISQVYVVGLSSGAALSLLLGCEAPEVFAGIGAIAGPSVGSDQWSALEKASLVPSTNVFDALRTCKSLAGAKAPFFATQVANIAYGDMDEDGPVPGFTYAGDTNHPGQYSLVSIKWSLDNARVLQTLYGTGDLGSPAQVQDGKGTARNAMALGAVRLSLLTIHNVGHAWPAGSGNPNSAQSGGVWMAQQGLDYPSYITGWFLQNNRRSNRIAK